MTKRSLSSMILVVCSCCLALSDCRRPFDPALKSEDKGTLVVEGFIDGGAITVMHLSRVREITPGDVAPAKNESNAHVSIEDDHQNSYLLTESGDGIYQSTSVLQLDPTHQYHVHITTANGNEYLSDFVPFEIAPAIDTVGWHFKDGGVQLYVGTHNDTNLTRYFRWDYAETWEFHVAHHSTLIYEPPTNTVVPRTSPAYTCWRSDNATSVLLGNTIKLSSNLVNEAPLVYIENHNDKLGILYSILVKQYAIDVTAYNFWFALKTNTETTGSIFDPQPNSTPGNLHSLADPHERVFGFVSAGTTTEKRIFVDHTIVPPDWDIPQDCHIVTVPNIPDTLRHYFNGAFAPISQNGSGGPYVASYTDCVDCTVRGTNLKPSFWP